MKFHDSQRLRARGKAKAQVALGNTQLKVYHALLSRPGTRHDDLGPGYYQRQRDIRRQIAHHVGQAWRPRLPSHPLPHPRTRPDRVSKHPGRLTQTPLHRRAR